MKRRSGPIATMGVLALLAVVFFGGMVKWMSDKPIIRLRPELEKFYGVNGFRCSLHLAERRVDVEVPAKLELPDRLKRREVAGEALLRYYRLTKGRTQIETCSVILPTGPTETVATDQANAYQDFQGFLPEVVRLATPAGAPAPATASAAPGLTGVAVTVDLTADDATVRKVVTKVLGLPRVTYVRARRGGMVVQESGVDAKLLASGAIAPVSSPTK